MNYPHRQGCKHNTWNVAVCSKAIAFFSIYIDKIMEHIYRNGSLKLFEQRGKNTILDASDVDGLDRVLIQCFSLSVRMPLSLFGLFIKT